jgi:hypothetical protein
MKGKYGPNWPQYASRAQGSSGSNLDAYALLKTMIDQWREVFEDAFPRNTRQKVRNRASLAFEARNATSHLELDLQDDEALRYLDAMHELLKFVKAPDAEIAEVKKLYDAQRAAGVAAPQTKPDEKRETTTQPAPSAETVEHDSVSGKALQPWIKVAFPHPDVLANRFKEAEFAADLFAVDSGNATEDYATAENFFRITYLTEGLRRVLTTLLQRIAGKGGDPVIGLQTAFGGGKTHTMMAAYHLARAKDLALLEGVADLAAKAGINSWKAPKVAVFVGTAKSVEGSLVLKDGPKVYTLWGYLGWRLAGDAGLKLMAQAEETRINPASELLVELFKLAGPSVILLDELVAYARQLSDDRFESFLSFIQSLTEAAKMVSGTLIIGSLPESAAEAGGAKGQEALLRLEKIFGRIQSAWLPASGNETYEIIRRRLFQTLDAEGEKARDETVKAFHELYRKNPAEFPPEAREPRYLELLRLSYPIHPELFERLSKDWASLDKFQRTRGVLRFMANVIGVLWQQQVSDPLITPARIPLSHERVRASVLYPLESVFTAVVDREVDGDSSLPVRMEANPSRRISQMRAATRAARAVFLCSAPLAGQPNAGLTGQGLRLACAEPGDQLAIFGEALRELSERATYLHEEAGRYWFSTQQTLNRLADEKAKAFPEHEVDAEIAQVLRDDAASRGGFSRIFAVPDDPTTVEEAQATSLVILGPGAPHAGKGVAKSAAIDAATECLTRSRSAQRKYRNTLLFVAADEALLATARDAMRRAMAWSQIQKDISSRKDVTHSQEDEAKEKARTHRDGAAKAVRLAWANILYGIKTEATTAGTAFDLERISISSKDRAAIPVAAYDKVKGDGIVKEKLGGESLSIHLKELWPQDRPHIAVTELADWFASYVYLPKLRDRLVLENAIREAVGKLDPAFGYADRYDEANDAYPGLMWAKPPADMMPASAVIVRKEVVSERLRRQEPVAGSPEPGQPSGGPTGGGISEPKPGAPSQPKRFFGSVEIDMVRPVKSFDAILNAVVMELQRAKGAKVKLTLEVEAETPDGFSDSDVGVVRDNAKQLKFKPGSTGFE